MLFRPFKHTFASIGPYAAWENIGKISASIPCQRKVKDHIEDEINHFHRGKSHTSPDKEKDVQQLQAAYHNGNVHVLEKGRKVVLPQLQL